MLTMETDFLYHVLYGSPLTFNRRQYSESHFDVNNYIFIKQVCGEGHFRGQLIGPFSNKVKQH